MAALATLSGAGALVFGAVAPAVLGYAVFRARRW